MCVQFFHSPTVGLVLNPTTVTTLLVESVVMVRAETWRLEVTFVKLVFSFQRDVPVCVFPTAVGSEVSGFTSLDGWRLGTCFWGIFLQKKTLELRGLAGGLGERHFWLWDLNVVLGALCCWLCWCCHSPVTLQSSAWMWWGPAGARLGSVSLVALETVGLFLRFSDQIDLCPWFM